MTLPNQITAGLDAEIKQLEERERLLMKELHEIHASLGPLRAARIMIEWNTFRSDDQINAARVAELLERQKTSNG